MKRTAKLPPPSLAPAFAWAGLCAALAIIAVVCSVGYIAPVPIH